MTAEINKSVAKLAESQIRQIMEMGQGMEGVIPLWFGEGDEATPEFIKQAAVRALSEDKTFYVPNNGVPELRQAIAEYMSRLYGRPVAVERITATTSGMHGIMLAYQTILDPGDTVVIIGPIWPNAVHAAEVLGASARIVALREVDGEWSIDLDELFAALDAGAKALFINSPNNPTGWMAERAELEAIFTHCRKNGIWMLCDDVYARLVYDGRSLAPSIAELAYPEDRVIIINSFSKNWNMTGWRLGWIMAPPDLLLTLAKLTEYNIAGPATFVQHAGIVALGDGEAHVARSRAAFEERRDLVYRRLGSLNRIGLIKPKGAFYAFFSVEGEHNSLALAKKILHDAAVGLAPGTAFGEVGEGYLRLCFAASPALLNEAMDRLERVLA
ncbi:MAG: pyridoxal phosphate-dependent aminotransferase [Alphaproteobacteria bacterium]|jgi:aspartate/methionine/tyrosine aminotransferase|nr:pyridoxal phosphate-dependent aminotransferase [Alphaproteobacteria bacterium]MDP6588260.1 pyridoxal phosphate-dependent aminotransferase [Alphaproteobacteria bacterium]MDP6818857.1 pyridoxal phosphate-dependent aminotransferase [Alphaproteobacteria bacterium]|tara:strand:+ start:113 stop:1270 length:1158 start_codon:yes stop_codon:yes gene_type:complete